MITELQAWFTNIAVVFCCSLLATVYYNNCLAVVFCCSLSYYINCIATTSCARHRICRVLTIGENSAIQFPDVGLLIVEAMKLQKARCPIQAYWSDNIAKLSHVHAVFDLAGSIIFNCVLPILTKFCQTTRYTQNVITVRSHGYNNSEMMSTLT